MSATSLQNRNAFKSFKRFSKRLLKGKAFRKSEFGTGVFDKKLRGALVRRKKRPAGYRLTPARLVIAPRGEGVSPDEPVRIFIGTEPAQHRAERVLLWSILKQCDARRRYEIYLMKDLKGFDRALWKTGFTAYRYGIPEMAGFNGRAIYNDVDQIYLADPAKLHDLDMQEKGVLAVESRDTSVMLMDCGLLDGVWNIDTLNTEPQAKIHTPMLKRVRAKSLIGDLPGCWNSRDHEYEKETSCLLHYTILHTQPWQPFPAELRYHENPLSSLWFDLEVEADREGFAPLWKQEQDRPYTDMKDFFTDISDA